MEHVTETEWIEYLAGTLPADRKVWIDNHIQNCSVCQKSHNEMLSFDGILEQWRVDVSGHDMADRITQAVQSKSALFESAVKHASHRHFWAMASKIAAALLIGVLLGHLAGRSSARQVIAKQQGTAVEMNPNYLAALNLQYSSGLVWSVLEEEPADSEEEQ